MFFMFFLIILIFLHAFRVADGRTWLGVVWDFIKLGWTSQAVASLLFVIGVIGFMIFVAWPGRRQPPEVPEEGGGGEG
jgi:hypothetical protein